MQSIIICEHDNLDHKQQRHAKLTAIYVTTLNSVMALHQYSAIISMVTLIDPKRTNYIKVAFTNLKIV